MINECLYINRLCGACKRGRPADAHSGGWRACFELITAALNDGATAENLPAAAANGALIRQPRVGAAFQNAKRKRAPAQRALACASRCDDGAELRAVV
ncbi:hypothetical protein RAS1_21940 [Phycisphaerae bacterium RAS1]|nr:hypothetical protein RAS1_21940 [Phycisphaerae bacterium RAS1]